MTGHLKRQKGSLWLFFILVGQKKWFHNLWPHHNVKSMGWVGTCGRGQQKKLYQKYSVGYRTQKWAPKLKNIFSVCAGWAILIGLNGCHHWVYYLVLFKIYGNVSRRRRISYNLSLNDDNAHLKSQKNELCCGLWCFHRLQGSSISGVTQHNSMG